MATAGTRPGSSVLAGAQWDVRGPGAAEGSASPKGDSARPLSVRGLRGSIYAVLSSDSTAPMSQF